VSRSLAVVLAVALVCVAHGAAATGSEPIYPMVSPDGAKIAWVEGATWRIWVANADGTGAHVFGPSFAQNGIGQITWTSHGMVVNSNYTLFVLALTGKRTKLSIVGDQAFSVGGTRAAVGSGQGTGPITVVDLLTGKVSRIGSPTAANGNPSLSPDGRRIVWGASGGLWTARTDGGAMHQLAAGGSCPQWSPDGRSIAYLSFPNDELRVIPAIGGRVRVLAKRAGGCNTPGAPMWSPDSSRVAFEPGGLATVNVKTGRALHSAQSLGRIAGGFAWSRDGSALIASARPAAQEAAHDNCTNLWQLDTKNLTGRAVVRGCP
jgi:Tol biopolymer transport system component